jgi:hypothetical protein
MLDVGEDVVEMMCDGVAFTNFLLFRDHGKILIFV